ncbi:uncharacterized protein JCM15063_002954 [Sporobolomyces koalae]|uniref:uncharacterized protein n=1 Tax=Sporobolomyces koalae TaxID=500713 RepID=UPI00317C9484
MSGLKPEYSALPIDLGDDPLHRNEDGYVPSPSYAGDGSIKPFNRIDPLTVDGNTRSQLEFYERELGWLRTENANLRQQIQNIKEEEMKQLKSQIADKKQNRECIRGTVICMAAFLFTITMLVIIFKIAMRY